MNNQFKEMKQRMYDIHQIKKMDQIIKAINKIGIPDYRNGSIVIQNGDPIYVFNEKNQTVN